MRLSMQTKPVSFVEDNAHNLADVLDESGEPLILTQDGEARVVLQSVKTYEETQETMAFLRLMLVRLGDSRVERAIPLDEVFERLGRRVRAE